MTEKDARELISGLTMNIKRSDMTPDEIEVLDIYESLSSEGKKIAYELMKHMAEEYETRTDSQN